MTQAIRLKRAGDSVGAFAQQEYRTALEQAQDTGSVADAVVNFALTLAQEKVKNGLRAAGLGLDDGEINAESIRAALSARIGAEVPELSPEGIMQAFNASMSHQIGRAVGLDSFDLMALIEGGGVETWARDVALQLVATGRPSKLVPASALNALKDAAVLVSLDMSPDERRAARNRQRQRRHRENYRQIWV